MRPNDLSVHLNIGATDTKDFETACGVKHAEIGNGILRAARWDLFKSGELAYRCATCVLITDAAIANSIKPANRGDKAMRRFRHKLRRFIGKLKRGEFK